MKLLPVFLTLALMACGSAQDGGAPSSSMRSVQISGAPEASFASPQELLNYVAATWEIGTSTLIIHPDNLADLNGCLRSAEVYDVTGVDFKLQIYSNGCMSSTFNYGAYICKTGSAQSHINALASKEYQSAYSTWISYGKTIAEAKGNAARQAVFTKYAGKSEMFSCQNSAGSFTALR